MGYLTRAKEVAEERGIMLSDDTLGLLAFCDRTATIEPTSRWLDGIAEAAIRRNADDFTSNVA